MQFSSQDLQSVWLCHRMVVTFNMLSTDTSHCHYTQRLRMVGAIPSLPPYEFSGCTETTSPLLTVIMWHPSILTLILLTRRIG